MKHACVIGTGNSGQRMVDALKLLEISSKNIFCYDVDSIKSKSFAEQNSIKWLNTLAEIFLIKQKMLCIISTPPSTHFEIASQLMIHGHVVLVEKPIFLNIDEIEIAKKIADVNLTQIYTIAQHRFDEGYLELKAFLLNYITDIQQLNLKISRYRSYEFFLNKKKWQIDRDISGGGVLITIGFHYLDLICNVLGIGVVNGNLFSSIDYGIENKIRCKLKFDHNIVCSLDMQWGPGVKNKCDTIEIILKNKEKKKYSGGKFCKRSRLVKSDNIRLLSMQLDNILNSREPLVTGYDVFDTMATVKNIYNNIYS